MSLVKRPFSRFHEPVTTGFSSKTVPKAGHPLIMDPGLMTPRALGLIPPGVVNPSDQVVVEVFFNRHPWELSMGSEFVGEMNANILAVLQRNPQAIVDSLSAIGHSYLADNSLAVLNYRARILATLRSMDLAKYSLEEMIFMLLGLSAIELVDPSCKTMPESTIPVVIANSAALIKHYMSLGHELSPLARYFTRALARQDMILSLVQLRRPLIPTSAWLDNEAQTSADRLMGYTATLMPLLEELCALAEDMKTVARSPACNYSPLDVNPADLLLTSNVASIDTTYCPTQQVPGPHTESYQQQIAGDDLTNQFCNYIPESVFPEHMSPVLAPDLKSGLTGDVHRAEDLRARIELWKPTLPHGLSFRKSRRFLSQASCYRAGALLYLFRLLNPPQPSGSSMQPSAVDEEAIAKAHEVLMSTNVAAENPDEVKMLLWPVFLAACEMSAEEDRQMVLDILDTILAQRKTSTVQKIKSFVLNRVWPARDQGEEWNWWMLAERYPGECLPI